MAEKKKKSSSGLNIKGRPKPNVPRAGYRSDKVRYEEGGKLRKKK